MVPCIDQTAAEENRGYPRKQREGCILGCFRKLGCHCFVTVDNRDGTAILDCTVRVLLL